MTQLKVYADDKPGQALIETREQEEIARVLGEAGVRYERWAADADLADDASDAEILDAYRASIERLKSEQGYQAVDVVHMVPDHPDREALRRKFLDEHTHAEDEVRFFVRGQGLFSLHVGDRVYEVLCKRGDLIGVPANTPHWFDMGPRPRFTAIRLFTNPEGWVARFTGSDIAGTFPRLDG